MPAFSKRFSPTGEKKEIYPRPDKNGKEIWNSLPLCGFRDAGVSRDLDRPNGGAEGPAMAGGRPHFPRAPGPGRAAKNLRRGRKGGTNVGT